MVCPALRPRVGGVEKPAAVRFGVTTAAAAAVAAVLLLLLLLALTLRPFAVAVAVED